MVDVWSPSHPGKEAIFAGVLQLHKANKKYLGFLPDAAFEDRATAGALIVARRHNTVVGYTIYDRPRSHLKLVHVCVDSSERNSGIASQLIDRMVSDNPNATGFEAHCRRDYKINHFWESLGMSPKGDRPGRGLRSEPLTIWWRPLGGPDLFDHLILETALPVAVLDTNIVIDLVASSKTLRPQRHLSEQLTGDWVESRVTLAVSSELDHELNDLDDAAERRHQVAGSQNLTRLPTNRPKDSTIEDALRARIGEADLEKDKSLEKDLNHLADAINAGARFFVTHDETLIRVTQQWIAEDFGLQVLMPFELVNELSDPGSVPTYQPRHLNGAFIWSEAASFSIDQLDDAFLNYPVQERKTDFRRRLKEVLAQRATNTAHVLLTEQQVMAGLLVTHHVEDELIVPLLRVRRGVTAQTLAFQLARQLRQLAVKVGAERVRVLDPCLHPLTIAALLQDGYRESPSGYTADALGGEINISEPAEVAGLATRMSVDLEGFAEHLTPELVAEIERRYWPLKIWDETTCLLVPIRPEHAMNLFGYPRNLIDQRESLGLARQHVYYRSPRNNPLKTLPARVLWYCSKDGRMGVHTIFAYSRIVGSHVLDPDVAHDRFHHMGVYRRADVRLASDKKRKVHVLEFEDTEILDRPTSLSEYREAGAALGLKVSISPSPRLISPTLLRNIYRTSIGAK
ncbi:MAG: GNAT family N-acetyltransferase [Terrimesophilobacter sp.]